jgi:hypothetical protein
MRTALQTGLWTTALALMLGSPAPGAEKTTLTGVVGDAMCSVKHMMAGDEAGCTRECVKQGSDYALIVDNKALRLKPSNESTKAELNKLAGKKARITGERDGDTITVASVRDVK